tara:strand:- start:3556 stop:4587 length:1032 start_codon:yes stop_codon:yes gene_type:complete
MKKKVFNIILLIKLLIYKSSLIFFQLIFKISFKSGSLLKSYSKKLIRNNFINYFEKELEKSNIFFNRSQKSSKNIKKNIKDSLKVKIDDLIIVGHHSTWKNFNLSSILITTKSDLPRFNSTIKYLKNLNINPLIHNGVKSEDLRNVLLSESIISESKASQIACTVSHIFAIEQILNESKDNLFLILEDDVRLFPDPNLIGLENVIKNKDWDIVSFEHNMPYTFKRLHNAFNHGQILQRWDNPKDYGASAYLIKREFAEKLVNYFIKLTSDGKKFDLRKTYLYHREIVPDQLIFDMANTLICTFPLSFQNTDYNSEIGYVDSQVLLKENTVEMIIKLWNRFYKF